MQDCNKRRVCLIFSDFPSCGLITGNLYPFIRRNDTIRVKFGVREGLVTSLNSLTPFAYFAFS